MKGKTNNENSNKIYAGEVDVKAVDFVLKNQIGEDWRLSDCLGQVITILFYPKNETLVCTKQLCSVRDNWTDYLETKAMIVGVSPATVEEHLQFGKKYKLPLPLLADTDRNITKRYGLHWLFPVSFTRAIVVIDAKGYIRTRRIMLRAFRPTDRSVITSIYAAKADATNEKYKAMVSKYRIEKSKFL